MRSLLLVILVAAACGKNNEPPPPSSGSPNAKPESGPRSGGGMATSGGGAKSPSERAQALYNTLCVTCHGPDGKGDGPAAAALNPKPRNYTDSTWQGSVTDEDLKKTIVGGGKAVGKSELMPAQPQLANDPEELDALVKIIRGFKGK